MADAAVILEPAGGPPAESWACLFVAHRPNEWILPGDLTTAIDLTEALVRAYTTPLRLA